MDVIKAIKSTVSDCTKCIKMQQISYKTPLNTHNIPKILQNAVSLLEYAGTIRMELDESNLNTKAWSRQVQHESQRHSGMRFRILQHTHGKSSKSLERHPSYELSAYHLGSGCLNQATCPPKARTKTRPQRLNPCWEGQSPPPLAGTVHLWKKVKDLVTHWSGEAS